MTTCYIPLMIVVFTCLLAGCARRVQFDVSVPYGLPATIAGNISNEIISIDLEQVKLTFQIQNFRGGGAGPPKPLGVWVGIQTKVKLLSLDPNLVFLM